MNMDIRKMDKMKQFGIVSLAIFGIIVILSIVFFKTCTSDYCDFSATNTLNIAIITFGIIGLVYCFFILKDFNTKIDKELMQDYKEILMDSPEEEMKLKDIVDQDQKNKKDNHKKIVNYFL